MHRRRAGWRLRLAAATAAPSRVYMTQSSLRPHSAEQLGTPNKGADD